MLEKARKEMNDHIVVVTEWKNFVPNLNKNNIVVIPWCEEKECEEAIKKLSAEEYVFSSFVSTLSASSWNCANIDSLLSSQES